MEKREKNFRVINKTIEENDDLIDLDLKHMDKISNFGVPVISKKSKEPYKKLFDEDNIEIRPIMGGNLTMHPFFKEYTGKKYVLKKSDFVHKNGFYVGNDPELAEDEICRIAKLLKN